MFEYWEAHAENFFDTSYPEYNLRYLDAMFIYKTYVRSSRSLEGLKFRDELPLEIGVGYSQTDFVNFEVARVDNDLFKKKVGSFLAHLKIFM